MTKVASIYVIKTAACITIGLSFIPFVTELIRSISNLVIGGMNLLLYGVIASIMLVIGIGKAVLPIGIVSLSFTAFSALTGIILNLILSKNKNQIILSKRLVIANLFYCIN